MAISIKNNYGPNIEVKDGGTLNLYQGRDGMWRMAEGCDIEDAEVIDDENIIELIDLKFFDMKRWGTLEAQQKLRSVLQGLISRMDVDSGRDWVAPYIAYHYVQGRLSLMKGYAAYFADIEALLPGLLSKINAAEPKGDKRYKKYTEALSDECSKWFVNEGCLPAKEVWKSITCHYGVDDDRRRRIQSLTTELFQGLSIKQ